MTWTPKYTITKEILSYLTKIESIKNSRREYVKMKNLYIK